MFAVVKTGGRQYRLTIGDLVKIGKIDAQIGHMFNLRNVLVVSSNNNDTDVLIGSPFIEGASVMVEVIEQTRLRKVITFKKRRRHNSQRRRGHRQELTVVRIREILTT